MSRRSCCQRVSRPKVASRRGQRERHFLEDEPGDLLDHVDLARHVACAPGRNRHRPVGRDVEADALEDLALPRILDVEPDERACPLRAEHDPLARGQLTVDVGVSRPARAGQLDDQLRRERRRRAGEIRVDALLPAVRALGAEREPLRAAEDPDRLEVRRLEQDARRRLGDLGLLAAHDPGERDRALRVGDHQVGRVELAQRPVERLHLLARPCAAYDDAAAQRFVVERVERVAEREHHVVRHVDDVRDRADAGGAQPRLQPDRRLRDLHVAEQPADIARAALGVVDPDLHRLVAVARRLDAGRRRKLAAEQCRDLARDPVDRKQIGPVARRLDVEHLLGERQHVGERRPRHQRGVEHHDPVVVGAEVDLVLGEDHPLRHLTAQLAPVECDPVRQRRAGERDRDLRARAEVPRAADDLRRLLLPHVDAAELEPVGIRMLRRLEHEPDAEAVEVAAVGRDAAPDDLVHLGGRDREPVRDLVRGRVDPYVLAEPGERNPQNCLRKRRSFSQNGRIPGMPMRSCAVRSIPIPNAKPVYSSGPQPTNS